MEMYKVNSIAEFYADIYNDMLNAPEVGVRGFETKEIIAPQILLLNPRNRIAYNEERKFSTKFAITEALLLFQSGNEVKYPARYNETMRQFTDDGVTLFGSYGRRIANNIPKVIDKLKADKKSRQAVLTILQKDDPFVDTKDIPCTLTIQFLIRDDKLNMIVNMRSNDIMWGLPYDMFMFSVLQEVIASTLNIELGWYLHRPASLHLYKRHYELFEKVANKFESKEVIAFKYLKYNTIKAISDRFIEQVDNNEEETTVDDIFRLIKL